MLKQMFMAGSLLMAVVFTGCAELREAKDPIDSDPAVATRFDGRWKVERQMFREGKPSSKQTGTAIGEMIGKHARLHSSDLKFELLFGIRQDGEYVLVNADSSRDRLLERIRMKKKRTAMPWRKMMISTSNSARNCSERSASGETT